MAATGPVVVHTHSGIEVKGRRRLGDPEKFDAMMEDLLNKVQEKATEDRGGLIADLDVSQNSLTLDQFEALFTQLGANNARVQRFRMFGCPTLDDNVMKVISDYMRLLTNESAPSEMHLSDCAITTTGWEFLISAIEETDLYPVQAPQGGPPKPLYLRLENNYIAEETIKEKMDAGIVRGFNKNNTRQRPNADGYVRVNLVVKPDGGTSQKQGDPPAPQDAPAPKNVWDKNSPSSWTGASAATTSRPAAAGGWTGGYGGGSWGGGGWAGGGKGGGKGAVVRPMTLTAPRYGTQALPAASYGGARPGVVRPAIIRPAVTTIKPVAQGGGKGMAGGFGAAGARPVQRITPGPAANASVWPRGNAGSAVDRSRTPAARGAPAQPAKPPPKKGSDLPYPWEEHWSEEYQIPYFWNSETGDSLWEKPTA